METDSAALREDTATVPDGARGDGGGDGDGGSGCPLSTLVHQRRRVNPESLALRLGPDLVRDLDALITPGNTEMPSFAVRKELQERYSIDRRHIYDYFHSRGLRVVKEDKHGNPVTTKSDLPAAPLPNLRPLRQVPVKSSRSHPSYSVAAERKLLKPRGVTKAKPGRPKKNPSANPKIVSTACETNESTDTSTSVSEHSSPCAAPKSTYIAVNPLHPPNSLPRMAEEVENYSFDSIDESFSVSRATGDIAHAYRRKLVFERMQELTEYPVKLALTDDQLASPCAASAKGLLLPHTRSLAWEERHAIYEALSDSLGPAYGIQECQGTYRKHMEARTKLYFEGLLSVPNHHAQQPTRTNAVLDRTPPLGTNEFRQWLSETRLLKRDGVSGSPRPHPIQRNTNVAGPRDADGTTDKQSRHRSISYWLQSLDDLFPTPENNCNNDGPLTDSPIVRSREVARVTTGVADGCNAGDPQLFSVTSNPNLPTFPVTASVAETQQTGRLRSHGLAGFPRSQEVETRMPVAEMDAHPLRLEHDPYVAEPGQRLVPSDTVRNRNMSLSNNARTRLPSRSPRKPHTRDLDRIRTRPAASRDARRRTTSAAGDI